MLLILFLGTTVCITFLRKIPSHIFCHFLSPQCPQFLQCMGSPFTSPRNQSPRMHCTGVVPCCAARSASQKTWAIAGFRMARQWMTRNGVFRKAPTSSSPLWIGHWMLETSSAWHTGIPLVKRSALQMHRSILNVSLCGLTESETFNFFTSCGIYHHPSNYLYKSNLSVFYLLLTVLYYSLYNLWVLLY